MTNTAKVIQQNTTRKIDHTSGEIIETSIEKITQFPTEPPYVKLYLDDVAKLYGLPKAGSDLLHGLLRKMDYDGIITLVSSSKLRIAKEIGVKSQTIDNTIQAMLKSDILQRVGRGEFMFNPHLFAKGEWKNIYKQRNKYVEMTISYSSSGDRVVEGKVISN